MPDWNGANGAISSREAALIRGLAAWRKKETEKPISNPFVFFAVYT